MNLVWSARFARAVKRTTGSNPKRLEEVELGLKKLEEDPRHPSLRTHKLKGDLAGSFACSIGYDLRIVFDFVKNPSSGAVEILLLTVGTHDEVY